MRQRLVHNNLFEFPRWKFVLGISVALLTSFCWYAFFYVMRETMRLGFYWPKNHPSYYELMILTDQEVLFYNFVYALIASIFGLSTCFQFWFHRARKYNENSIRYLHQSSIFTDITGLNSIFISWFSRAVFFFAAFGGISLTWCYFQLYPTWIIFWVLLILVLFLEMWKTIRKVAFRESRKWMLIAATSIVVWSFFLSRIQILDYKGINDAYINSSVTRKYQIEYPESDYYRKVEHLYLVVDIHMCFPVGATMDSLPKVFVNQKETGFDIHEKVEEEFEKRWKQDWKLITAILHIDQKMPMKYVKKLKGCLTCNQLRRIGYRVFPADQGECARAILYGLIRQLPPCPTPEFVSKTLKEINDSGLEKIFIKLTPTELYINEEPKEWQEIRPSVRNFITNHSKYLVVLDVDDECIYDDYIKINSSLSKIILELRDDFSIEKYGKLFDDLPYELQDEIGRKVFPLSIYEPFQNPTQ